MVNDVPARPQIAAPQGFLDGVLREVGLLDRYALVQTPLGPMYAATSDVGLTAVMPASDDDAFVAEYRRRFGRKVERDDTLAASLQEALEGGDDAPEPDLRGCNPFQRDVLLAARRIPAGAVRPYAWIAQAVGRPRAVRAVGTALAHNPVPLAVPCHRVVRSDGAAGEYVFGAERKAELLRREGVDLDEVQRRQSLRAVWSEDETTYCEPFCFVARPLPDLDVRVFRDAREAQACGLTPCRTCHPAVAA